MVWKIIVDKYTPLMISELLGVSKPMIAAHIQVLLKKGYIDKALPALEKMKGE